MTKERMIIKTRINPDNIKKKSTTITERERKPTVRIFKATN